MFTDFYQFSEKPFEDNPDLKFFFSPPSCQKILTSMITWIHKDHGFATITGEAEVGKTFFIHALINLLGEKVITILVPNPVVTFRDLLKEILWQLNQPIRGESETILSHQFEQYFDQIIAQGKTLLIILDEAQGINDRTLKAIEQHFALTSKPIRIIFVGQPHLEERLQSMGLRRLGQKIKTKQKIQPLTEEESKRYIAHRLQLVGGNPEIITPKAISMICSYTRGIPILINHICDNALRIGCVKNQKKIDVDIIEIVVQNLEGPKISKKILPSIRLIKQIWKSPIQYRISFKRVSMIILLLGCMGGLLGLIYATIKPGALKIQEIKTFIGQKLTAGSLTRKPSTQGTIKGIPTKDKISSEDKLTDAPSKLSSFQQEAGLPTPPTEKSSLAEVIVVKKGETLSILTKNHYRMTNPTLMDLILQSNPEIINANIIRVDQRIKIPQITEESLLSQSPDQTFKIHVGTFWSSEVPRFYRDQPALRGKRVEMIPLKISPTQIWYRVLLGNFQTRDEALDMIAFLKKNGGLPSFESSLKTR